MSTYSFISSSFLFAASETCFELITTKEGLCKVVSLEGVSGFLGIDTEIIGRIN